MDKLIMCLIPLLIQVESGGQPNPDSCIGDNGNAVGCLQIWEIVVDDCNRIQKQEVFEYADRLSRPRSIRIAQIYLAHYGQAYERKTGHRANLEVLARCWNGGPNGYKKQETLKYWQKIVKTLTERTEK